MALGLALAALGCDSKKGDCETLGHALAGAADIKAASASLAADAGERIRVDAVRKIADAAEVLAADLAKTKTESPEVAPAAARIRERSAEVVTKAKDVAAAAAALAASEKKLAALDTGLDKVKKTSDAGEKLAGDCLKKVAQCKQLLELLRGMGGGSKDEAEIGKLATDFEAVKVEDADLKKDVEALVASLKEEASMLKALHDLKAELESGVAKEEAAFTAFQQAERTFEFVLADLATICK